MLCLPFLGRSNKRLLIMIIAIVVLLILIAVIIAVVVVVTRKDKKSEPATTTPSTAPTAKTIKLPPTGPPGSEGPYKRAVVASDAGPCSDIGRNILKTNGSAMDSAVAALFCIGVYNVHSAGVGGGGFMTVYHNETNAVEVIDFREEAPGKANRTMYVGGKMSSKYGKYCHGFSFRKGFYLTQTWLFA